MKKLNIKFALVLLVALLTLAGCSSTTPNEEPENPERVFTIDELSEYNGKDGSPAYVAVDGVVYDVTDVDAWPGGSHNGHEAGQDLTEEIKEMSPHGTSVLDNIPVVGVLED